MKIAQNTKKNRGELCPVAEVSVTTVVDSAVGDVTPVIIGAAVVFIVVVGLSVILSVIVLAVSTPVSFNL